MGLDTNKMRMLREELGLTQEQAADKAGFLDKGGKPNRQLWHQVEAGHRANITLDTLEGVARALRVKARDLLK